MVDNYDYIQLLATKFAPTLESLVANSLGPRFTGRLLFSDNNQPIVYPNLKTLDITGPWYGKCPDTLSTDKHFVPFPKLRYLRWGVAYIFVDDTLFRGNYDTLEYLYLLLDSDSFDNLRKCGVLSAGKFPKLTHISVDNHMYHTAQVASDLLTSTVFGMITPTTRSLALEGNQILHQHIVNAIPASIYAENIQVLSFGRTHLNADKMFEIIRLLPRMTHFTCNPLNRDSKLDVQVNKPFPDWAYEKYYPLSTRLKCWVVVDTSIISIKFLVSLAIALAILCPNLSLVNIPNKCMDEYQREMNRVLGRRIYAKYAEDIKRLLYFELSTSRNSGNCYLQ
ncbi:hypothetical protein LPJ59_001606 [Coemansia sp. RSA 2399]|nr:hypothetical protein LPJ59_001606 [Coemansia sp. RSA 2399]